MTLSTHNQEQVISIDDIPTSPSTPQSLEVASRILPKTKPIKQIISRAFFGKKNCLKVTFNNLKECYFEFGTTKDEKLWAWKKVKMNDAELGDILRVLEGKTESVSFFHDFKGDKTQIWINKKDDLFFIKVRELSKSLSTGEQRVLEELLRFMIMRSSLLI